MDLRRGVEPTGETPVVAGGPIDPLLRAQAWSEHVTSPVPPPPAPDEHDELDGGPGARDARQPADVTPVPTRLAFEDFYRSQRREVGRALAVTFGDHELAAEAVDEAMTRAYARWAKVGTLANPGGWVYRVGFNWGISVLRRRRRTSPSTRADEHVHQPPVAEPAVAAALAALPPAHRAVVVCRLMLGWSERQTADALRIRPGTVKSRLHRANARLQSQLHHLKPEGSS